jgi:hypothetical protein
VIVKLKLVAATPELERLIATAILTTSSGSKPSTIFNRLAHSRERVERLVDRIEVHHGSILDHNRLCWIIEATEGEVLDIYLRHRFFSFTKLEDSAWLVSGNLRTAVSYARQHRDNFGEALIKSLEEITPKICSKIRGESR